MSNEPLPIPPLLDELLRVDAPSGVEQRATEVWRRAASFAELSSDGLGSAIARVGEARPLLALVGHVDEIGLIVTHIDERGYLWFAEVGGWDPQVLVGQRVTVRGRHGNVPGVIGRGPIHLLFGTEQMKRGPELADLCIDIGVATEAEAAELVAVGDTIVAAGEPLALAGNRVVSKAMDNRVGAYVALESLRRCAEGEGPAGSFAAVASAQEETGLSGARTSAFALRPDVAIAVDGWVESDSPGVDKRRVGTHPFGSGPIIGRGSNLSRAVGDMLIETAEELGIGYSVCGYGSDPKFFGIVTSTDADALHDVADGIATGVVSVPTRYLHTAVEMVDLADVEATVQLLAAFGSRLDEERLARLG